MPDASAGPTREITYAVEFERLIGRVTNPDFSGAGVLTIRPDGPTCIFSGKPRGLVAPKSSRLVLGPADITNVEVTGRAIHFSTHLGQAGKKNEPFGFSCRNEAEAQAVAALLPKSLSRDATESRDFIGKLNAVSPPVRPWTSVTNLIIALNLVMFVIMGALGAGWLKVANIAPYILYGANNGAATTDGEWWRLLTSMFMHYGALHLLFNMWALFAAGGFLEKLQGRALFAIIYLGSGLAGGFASIGWHGDRTWSAGASGAVFGVYGALLGYMLRQKKALPAPLFKSMLKSSFTFAAYNLLFGFARPGIDQAAHLGGAAGGIALGWMLALPLEPAPRARLARPRLILGLVAVGILVGAGIALAPRYDYRIVDEFAWNRANRPFRTREDALIQENELVLRQLARGKVDPAYPDWLEAQLIPFYEDWGRAMRALSFTPDKTTARTQAETLRIFEMRLASYRRLVAGLRAKDRDAAREFFAENAKVSDAIIKMQRTYAR